MKTENGRPADVSGRIENEIKTYELLDSLGVGYLRVDHEPAMTMEACLAIDDALGAAMCKNLFLCNRQQTDFYLLLMPGDKPFKTKALSAQLGVSRLSFGNEEKLGELLGLTPGSVTVFGLMNDGVGRVRLLIDSDLLGHEYIGCHPCINTSSLRLKTDDLISKVLPALGHDYTTVKL